MSDLNCSDVICIDKCNNSSDGDFDAPREELLIQQNYTVIFVYSALFVVAAIGNLTVFISLLRSRHRKSRISLMICHLAIADLIVTFIMIPIEVGWRMTGRWIAGNLACKAFLFLRAFGPYLSSNVLVCVSLDRYFAVLHPLKVNDARRRGKILLAFAWGTSFIYCIPQSFVFRVQAHPKDPHYTQCVSFGFFTSRTTEVAYNLLCVMFMYFIPLFVIISAYTAIMCEISKNSKETKGESYCSSNGRMRLRRSDISNIERARSRTLRMTITIVAVYIWCCTPYVIITLWYMFDRASASKLPVWLQDTFFMMVVSNSCMNPIVYGSYVMNFSRFNCRYFKFCCKRTNSDIALNNGEAAAQMPVGGRRLARTVIKCVFRLQKVGSGATRSTGTLHNKAITPSPTNKVPSSKITNFLLKTNLAQQQSTTTNQPTTINHRETYFLSEHSPTSSSSRGGYRTSFHSEPCCPSFSYMDEPGTFSQPRHHHHHHHHYTQTTTNVATTPTAANSEPNMSPQMCTVKMNINEAEVYYNNSDRTRSIRNI